jgi:hypothetical protein
MPDLITLAIPAFLVLLFAEAIAGAMMRLPAQIAPTNRPLWSLHESR